MSLRGPAVGVTASGFRAPSVLARLVRRDEAEALVVAAPRDSSCASDPDVVEFIRVEALEEERGRRLVSAGCRAPMPRVPGLPAGQPRVPRDRRVHAAVARTPCGGLRAVTAGTVSSPSRPSASVVWPMLSRSFYGCIRRARLARCSEGSSASRASGLGRSPFRVTGQVGFGRGGGAPGAGASCECVRDRKPQRSEGQHG
jgi:hypothetical protein